jgi:hypothetical protein
LVFAKGKLKGLSCQVHLPGSGRRIFFHFAGDDPAEIVFTVPLCFAGQAGIYFLMIIFIRDEKRDFTDADADA